MKKPNVSPDNPLLARVNGIPLIIYFHAWVLRRGIFYTMASAYVRALFHLSEHFKANPADITPKALAQFCARNNFSKPTTTLYFDAYSLWKEYWARRDKTVPGHWETTTGVIADVLGVKSRMVVRALKYYAVEKGVDISVFERQIGGRWKAYMVPIGFFKYAERIKESDDSRWRTTPPTPKHQ